MTETSTHDEQIKTSREAPGDADVLSSEAGTEARRYGRISLATTIADMAIDVVYMGLMAFLFARPIDAWLATFAPLAGEQSYWRLVALFGVVLGLHALVSAPLSFYDGYIVEHQFKLSNQSIWRWLRNWLMGNTLAAALGVALNLGLFWIMWNTGNYWWAIAAGAFFVVSIIMGQLAPVLIMPLFYKVERLENPELSARMERLAAGTGLTIEGVYRMGLSADTKKANAMLAGVGRTRRVLMGDTLLDEFSPDEIEVIFAHEIGHHVHRHIPKMIITGGLLSLVGFWLVNRVLLWWAGISDASQVPTAALPLVTFTLSLFMLLLSPLQNAISRFYERQCDRYALARTANAAAYRSAFTKLATLNKADPDPNPIEVLLLHSHPPIKERLALVD